MTRLEFEASLVMVIVPKSHPVAAGENLTLIYRLCPGPNIAGSVTPKTVNSVELALTAEIVTLA